MQKYSVSSTIILHRFHLLYLYVITLVLKKDQDWFVLSLFYTNLHLQILVILAISDFTIQMLERFYGAIVPIEASFSSVKRTTWLCHMLLELRSDYF